MRKIALACLLALSPSIAVADNIANCELVLMETIEDESGRGGAQVASYRPAADFMASVYEEDAETLYAIDDLAIRAVMCQRFDVIPTKSDFKIMATGIPFFLSQSFESQDSDLVSLFFKDGEFHYTYKGPGLSEEAERLLQKRLKAFNAMDHDLREKEEAKKESAAKAKAEKDADKDPETKQSTEEADAPLAEEAESE